MNLNIKLSKIVLDSENGKKIDEEDLKQLQGIVDTTEKFLENRTVSKERDLEFFRRINASGRL